MTMKQRKLYDKKDQLNFSIVRLPYKVTSLLKYFNLTTSAKNLRICRAISSLNDFLLSVHTLISRMKKQGAELNNIIKVLSKMIFCHPKDFLKFNIKQKDIVKDITP